jgi:hypothetical protein
MNNKWKGCGRMQRWPVYKYQSCTFLEVLRKTTKYLRTACLRAEI